ncbi:hypothetical protein [Pandoraea oxalativorans]|nr:hypothetical protein [Pandoraea oxalativorans]
MTHEVARHGALDRAESELVHRSRIGAYRPHTLHLTWGPRELGDREEETPPTEYRWGENTMWPPPKAVELRVVDRLLTKAQLEVIKEEMRRHGTELEYLHFGTPECRSDEVVVTKHSLQPIPVNPAEVIASFQVAPKLKILSLDLSNAESVQNSAACAEVVNGIVTALHHLPSLERFALALEGGAPRPDSIALLFDKTSHVRTLKAFFLSLSESHGFGKNNVELREAWRSLAKMSSLEELHIYMNNFLDDDMQVNDAAIADLCEAVQSLSALGSVRLEFGVSETTFASAARALELGTELPLRTLHVRDYRDEAPEAQAPIVGGNDPMWQAAPPLALEQLTLEVKGMPYSMRNIVDLFAWIGSARTLKSLSLDISSIREIGANNSLSRHIFRKLSALTLLETLVIRTNANVLMDDAVVMALDEALRNMPWLRTLRLEMDGAACTDDALDRLFDTVANELDYMVSVYVQARGCEKINEGTVRQLMAFHFTNTNVTATVVLSPVFEGAPQPEDAQRDAGQLDEAHRHAARPAETRLTC